MIKNLVTFSLCMIFALESNVFAPKSPQKASLIKTKLATAPIPPSLPFPSPANPKQKPRHHVRSPKKSPSRERSKSKSPHSHSSTRSHHSTSHHHAATSAPMLNEKIEFATINCAQQINNRCAFHAILNAWYLGSFLQRSISSPNSYPCSSLNERLEKLNLRHANQIVQFIQTANTLNSTTDALNRLNLQEDEKQNINSGLRGGFTGIPTVFWVKKLISENIPTSQIDEYKWQNPFNHKNTVSLDAINLDMVIEALNSNRLPFSRGTLIPQEQDLEFLDLTAEKIKNFAQGQAPLCLVFNTDETGSNGHWICAGMIHNPKNKNTSVFIADSYLNYDVPHNHRDYKKPRHLDYRKLEAFVNALLGYAAKKLSSS